MIEKLKDECVKGVFTVFSTEQDPKKVGSSNRNIFKVSGMASSDKLTNLQSILLQEEDLQNNRKRFGNLPTNKNVYEILRIKLTTPDENNNMSLEQQKPVLNVFIWTVNNTKTFHKNVLQLLHFVSHHIPFFLQLALPKFD